MSRRCRCFSCIRERNTREYKVAMEMTQSVYQEGRNFWKKGRAHRVTFIIDARDYFAAFVEAVLKAERSVYITGWDIDSQLTLIRGEEVPDFPVQLGEFLSYAVHKKPQLHVNILDWDFSVLYTFKREYLPAWKFAWKTGRRVHFHLDNYLPPGASHHQKIVVIDDRIAFAGGIDLTHVRWDTPEHLPDDPRRSDPWEERYPPSHDVQILVDGEPAAFLGELFRQRWRYATRKELPLPEATASDPWPQMCIPDIHDIDVAISRTQGMYREKPEIREVESLWVDAIAAARRHIYIESPFFTSSKVAGAISKRLYEKDGPEIVVVTRKKSHGWLEESTMDAIRVHLVKRVKRVDADGRFGIYYTEHPGRPDDLFEVHSKILIVDDTFLRIGSSNISNRSMGLDSECDLSLETWGHAEAKKACRNLRDRLLAEHLGSTLEKVREIIEKTGSLIRAVEILGSPDRTMRPLDISPAVKNILSEPYLVDPERPIDPDDFIERFIDKEDHHSGRKRLIMFAALMLTLIALAATWKWSPLAGYLDIDAMSEWIGSLSNNRLMPLIVVALYVLGGLVVFPVTVMVAITAVLFPPLIALALSVAGAMMSASVVYWIGRIVGRDFVRRVAGKRINQLSRRLARQGLLAMTIIRFIPVAPFSVVNLVAGASHIRFRDYFIGTLIGMTPGFIAITLFTESLISFLFQPNILNVTILIGITLAAVVLLIWLKRRIAGRVEQSAGERA
ncbi:MAG TPA: VTT domain-containing protein [Deltaproteobacteria bacterium]|nr:VTT domain-containing protein [Deltaproteobacteria bacterium]